MKRNGLIWRGGKRVLLFRDAIKGLLMTPIVKYKPQWHAKLESRRQKSDLIRKPDIINPIYFNEKMLYLKYFLYNKSPLVAKCYNKFEVRDYLIEKGCGDNLNELYGAWDTIDEIPWDSLPEEYVIKVANGYSGHVFKRSGQPFSKKEAARRLKNAMYSSSHCFKISGDLFAYGTKQKIICEKILRSSLGYVSPEDYKFYCFHGEPLYLQIMWNRYGVLDGLFCDAMYDINLNERFDLAAESMETPSSDIIPICFSDMVKLAKKLSSDFPFVRVDFYVENDHPIFGELTFTPFYAQTVKSMNEMGELIRLDNIEYYKHLLGVKC